MVKNILSLVAVIVFFTSCSSLKPLQFTSNKQVGSESGETAEKSTHTAKKSQVQFIDDIAITPAASTVIVETKKESVKTRGLTVEPAPAPENTAVVEKASNLQLKYSILLNTEVERLQNTNLLEKVDEWYGTRYRLGGTTKKGVDCSAFVQSVFLGAFAVSLPRTAREQYRASRRISRTELKEGDLVFFNTTGGVSHVGIYLQNNKFIHASASKGVTVSDLFDPYYLSRFIGAGRVANKEVAYLSN
jgi:cell wall-associated NlpC family hydrolase